jgi:hypothetical protein
VKQDRKVKRHHNLGIEEDEEEELDWKKEEEQDGQACS